jgi:predicted alpha/beta hydrolase family esterase
MEDLEELEPQKKIIEMERWNISDLKDYISKLELEIAKAKKIIQRKESVNDSVNNLFK